MASSMNETGVSVFDDRPVGALQWAALTICGFCMVVDGFDVQAMAYAAPALLGAWHIDRTVLGPVFGAGLLGMLVGSLALAGVADRIGRRPALIAATLWVALLMAFTPSMHTVGQLIGGRFAAGIGMGVIIPNAMALAGEYSPARMRATLMMAVSSGYVLGGVAGGAVASLVIARFGWGGVFHAGAILTALLCLVMVCCLPESLQFCLLRRPDQPRTRRLLSRVAPDARLPLMPDAPAVSERQALSTLFTEGRARSTPILWAANFANMLCAYFLAAWIPVLMSDPTTTSGRAALAGTTLWLGGLAGNVLLGALIDLRGFAAVLQMNFVVGGLAIAGLSLFYASPREAMLLIALAGFCVLGGQSGLNALAVSVYPTEVRATGAGWASGIGRLGAVVGPAAGGYLMAFGWSADRTLLIAALPAAGAAAAIGMLGRRRNSRFRRSESRRCPP
ncbi:aromatic acid/H+ symport family MFS transporter (plasmid) [Burkholderia sp. JP2-270]|uniref:MFS transporter n=1 Tax=Burkholderia sp. JP2-270 TaxID=2217913 RepID=UPI000DA2FE37|nr:MFS transporter [Burkholderia sp. JP2-270]AWV05653.1 aromatic acid/H+ symport family MFS transporter [Burkholderia sp. JP2-270]